MAGKARACDSGIPHGTSLCQAALFWVKFLDNGLEKAVEDDPSVWAPTTHAGVPEGARTF